MTPIRTADQLPFVDEEPAPRPGGGRGGGAGAVRRVGSSCVLDLGLAAVARRESLVRHPVPPRCCASVPDRRKRQGWYRSGSPSGHLAAQAMEGPRRPRDRQRPPCQPAPGEPPNTYRRFRRPGSREGGAPTTGQGSRLHRLEGGLCCDLRLPISYSSVTSLAPARFCARSPPSPWPPFRAPSRAEGRSAVPNGSPGPRARPATRVPASPSLSAAACRRHAARRSHPRCRRRRMSSARCHPWSL